MVAVNAVIGLAYYVRVVAVLVGAPGPAQGHAEYTPAPPRPAVPVVVAVVAATVVAIVIGFAPQLVFNAITP